MRTAKACLASCALLLATGSTPAGSAPPVVPVTAKVSPVSGLAPANVLVEAFIEPDADNRELTVIIDSGTFYSSSTISLDGEKAARSSRVLFRMLPAGQYRVRVTLIGATGPRGSFERSVDLV